MRTGQGRSLGGGGTLKEEMKTNPDLKGEEKEMVECILNPLMSYSYRKHGVLGMPF